MCEELFDHTVIASAGRRKEREGGRERERGGEGGERVARGERVGWSSG